MTSPAPASPTLPTPSLASSCLDAFRFMAPARSASTRKSSPSRPAGPSRPPGAASSPPTLARRKPRPSNCSKAPCTPAHNPKSPKLSPPACKHPSRVTSKNSFTPERKGRRAVVGKGEGHQRKCGVRRAACGMRLRFCQVAMPAGSQTLTSRLPACLR